MIEEELTSLKNEGNEKYAAGEVEASIRLYSEAIRRMGEAAIVPQDGASASPRESLKTLGVVLYSNLANAYISIGDFEKGWQAAWSGTKVDPTAWKPWARYITARRCGGYPFDAFVHCLRYLRPLLRHEREAGRLTARDVSTALAQVEEPLIEALGLSRLSPAVELVDYAGGMAMISRRHFDAKDIIFIEQKYKGADFEEMSLHAQPDLTTESIVGYFAQRLRPEQAAQTTRWKSFRKHFSGAWPRSEDEMDIETRTTIGNYLRERFPDVPEDEFRDLLMTSLMCRYNCFHSGFFRTCALANHSCHANIAMKYSSIDETVKMIAVDAIEPGELMNVKYLSDAHFLLGVGKRRELLRSWLFWCTCNRCIADSRPDAVPEYVKCASCGAYSHSALLDGEPTSDTLLTAIEPCRKCSNSVAWGPVQRSVLKDELMHSLTTSIHNTTASSLAEWMSSQLHLVSGLQIHSDHWIYRVLFYFLGVALTSIVEMAQAPLSNPRLSQSDLDAIKLLYVPCGLQQYYQPLCAAVAESDVPGTVSRDELLRTPPEAGGGCEFLKSLVILWMLLKPFYPLNEMWAIHDAILKLVLMHEVLPTTQVQLSPKFALLLIERHGGYIGEGNIAKWLHRFSMHRSSQSRDPIPVVKIKKAFKG